ncbi:helix-turn-helix domain-containing protein [Gordonia sp. i37]|uniref:GlxA family transcriptional regulator n=1 Tax=Gordonia sp. i37 TaxID=1961707 RepID=UPI0009AC5474|nr:helix-turn-helix domain-containing protein [Gordonia sp. i37]OPX13498.1 AraC family transcriptional regulator [Gordonia sp. i37]
MADLTRVGILAYPGCFASEIFGITDVLTMGGHVARAHHQEPSLVTSIVSPRRRVVASGDIPLQVSAAGDDIDVLVIPGFEFVPGENVSDRLADLAPEIEVIGRHVCDGRPVVSVCVGAFLLGAAGVLDGRTVTTAWLFADALRQAFPCAVVDDEKLVVTDEGVTTTAAFSAMYDFVVDLIESRHGDDVARRTARIALLDDARSSQTPYVDTALLPPAGSSFAARVQRHLEHHLTEPYSLKDLAAQMSVSTRTLLRTYKRETGESPLTYLQRARIRRAQHLLASTDRTLGDVRRAVGYQDGGAFSDLFTRHTGMRPREYRGQFGRA